MPLDSVLLTLQALERELHEANGRHSRERLAALLHPQFHEFGRSGVSYTHAQVVDQLLAETAANKVHSRDFAAVELGPSVVLLTYKSANVAPSGALERHTNRSSIWRLEPRGWQMLFHQGTPTEPFAQSVPTGISVHLLADHPLLIPAVGEMRLQEWGNAPERQELQWWIDVTAREAGRDALPVTWVAIDDRGRAVGAVGLAEFDLEERRDRSPWLVGMIVSHPLRGSGVGGMLVQKLKGWAAGRGYAEVWVATGGRAVDFYRKYGWHLFEVLDQSSGEATVLRCTVQSDDA